MRKIILTIAALVLAASAWAQDFQTGYFLNGYTQAYKLNPAIRPDKSFLALPGIGGFDIISRSNIGLDDIFYPVSGGKLGTFMHPEVDAKAFLNRLKSSNKVVENNHVNILGLGFRKGLAYHTFDISIRTAGGASVPYELFSFLKEGISDHIVIPSLSVEEDLFLEVAYGLNFKVNGIVSVGGRIKYLAGLMNTRVGIENLTVSTDYSGRWMVSGSAYGKMAWKGATAKTKADEAGETIIDGVDTKSFDGVAGHGAAIDLGVVVDVIPGVRLSAALCDVGGVKWNYNIRGKRDSVWEYNGDADDVEDDLANLLELKVCDASKEFRMLPATFRLGAEWSKLPFVTFGLLGTHRFGNVPWTELRASANFKPSKVLGASVSAAAGSFGFSWGAAMNLNLKVINLFLGMDAIPTRFTPQFIPLGKANLGLSFGINITY